MIRAVVFDFDGTLVLSNGIKRDGFFAIAADFPGGSEFIAGILANLPGDRYAIFSAFAERYSADGLALVSRYSDWCEDRIVHCPERTGAAALLNTLKRSHASVYVISATPPVPLRAIVKRRYPPDTFDGVFGGHGGKVRNLRAVLSGARLEAQEILVVGDGIDDYRAALTVGCAFAGVAGGTLAEAALSVPLLSDLTKLQRYFPEARAN